LNLRLSGYERDGRSEAFFLVDAHFSTVLERFQVPAVYRCSPLFTDGLVHRWYIAATNSGRLGDQAGRHRIDRCDGDEVHLAAVIDLLDTTQTRKSRTAKRRRRSERASSTDAGVSG
jgi:hypothetical protein